jgi:glycosyltransferase involved in cell wall biosynthesis
MPRTSANPPRKILYVVSEDYAFLSNCQPMARAARESGFEVHVATNVDNSATAIEAEGFFLHKIPFRRGKLSPITAIPTLLAIRRVEKQIKPDIVHHSGLQCCVYASAAALDQRFLQVNAITGLGYVFTSGNWRTQLLRGWLVWLLRWLLNRRNSHVLVQNPDDRDTMLSLGIERDRITLIPGSGVDTDVLQPMPEPPGAITLGFAGRLLGDKGIRELVAAHDILREEGHDYRLVIAGNPDPLNPSSVSLDEVKKWAERPGITWLGYIDDIMSLWRICHIAVLPSYREGLPLSLLEAAACGRPLIATDAPGCREIVQDKITGLLVPVESPTALAHAIQQLAKSQEQRIEYGANARRLVEHQLSAKTIGTSTTALYKRLVSGR